MKVESSHDMSLRLEIRLQQAGGVVAQAQRQRIAVELGQRQRPAVAATAATVRANSVPGSRR